VGFDLRRRLKGSGSGSGSVNDEQKNNKEELWVKVRRTSKGAEKGQEYITTSRWSNRSG